MTNLMICDLCNTTLHPLNAHTGRDKDGNLITTHIDCWNKYYAKEIEIEKQDVKRDETCEEWKKK